MKKAFHSVSILLLLAALFFTGCSSSPESKLVGKWWCEDKGIGVEFHANGTVSLVEDDWEEVFGEGTYKVDFSATPIAIDFVVDELEGSNMSIIEFVDDNTIRLTEPRTERPTDFDGAVELKKME